jgi:hypothetical protein
MAITEVGNHSSVGATTAVSDTHGLSINANDVAVCLISHTYNATCTDNNGATPFTATQVNWNPYGDGSHHIIHLWTRVTGASEPAAFAFTLSGAKNWAMVTRVFRGVDPVTPWDYTPNLVNWDANVSSTASVPTMNTSSANALALAMFIAQSSGATFSGITNSFTAEKNESRTDMVLGTYTKAIAAAGAVGATAVTLSTSCAWTAFGGALKNYEPGFTGLTVTKLLQG